jgi:hypothetical protein
MDRLDIHTHDSSFGGEVLFYRCFKSEEFPMEAHRYNVHKNLNIYWSVFDEVTGQNAVINGFVMDMLTAEEAKELVGALNREVDQEFLLAA